VGEGEDGTCLTLTCVSLFLLQHQKTKQVGGKRKVKDHLGGKRKLVGVGDKLRVKRKVKGVGGINIMRKDLFFVIEIESKK
jgi:hypothetical protein